LVERFRGGGVVVVSSTVAVTTCYRTICALSFGTFTAAVATIRVAHGRSDVVAVTIVVAVVRVVMVVVVIDGSGTVRMRSVRMIPRIVVGVIRSVPAPAVVEAAIVPAGTIVIGTIIVVRPPPVVTQVDANAPAGRAVVVPVHVGEEGVVVAPSGVNIGVKSAETGTVAVVVELTVAVESSTTSM
jgi:hypothetical protein